MSRTIKTLLSAVVASSLTADVRISGLKVMANRGSVPGGPGGSGLINMGGTHDLLPVIYENGVETSDEVDTSGATLNVWLVWWNLDAAQDLRPGTGPLHFFLDPLRKHFKAVQQTLQADGVKWVCYSAVPNNRNSRNSGIAGFD